MDKLFLDTNILIDFICADRPGHKAAERILRSGVSGESEVHALASSLKDVYYVLCRLSHNEAQSRKDVRSLRKLLYLEPLTPSIVDAAFASDEPDFEDALVRACAETIGAHAVITRDKAAFAGSSIPSRTAEAYTSSE